MVHKLIRYGHFICLIFLLFILGACSSASDSSNDSIVFTELTKICKSGGTSAIAVYTNSKDEGQIFDKADAMSAKAIGELSLSIYFTNKKIKNCFDAECMPTKDLEDSLVADYTEGGSDFNFYLDD